MVKPRKDTATATAAELERHLMEGVVVPSAEEVKEWRNEEPHAGSWGFVMSRCSRLLWIGNNGLSPCLMATEEGSKGDVEGLWRLVELLYAHAWCVGGGAPEPFRLVMAEDNAIIFEDVPVEGEMATVVTLEVRRAGCEDGGRLCRSDMHVVAYHRDRPGEGLQEELDEIACAS